MKKKYVLVIVDDFTRYTWVKFLKTKDETPSEIISFIKTIQVRLQLSVQSVRTDNGMEFKNHTLSSFYYSWGITQTFSAAITPEQNGVVERRNRTLVEAARSMLAQNSLPQFCGQRQLILHVILKIDLSFIVVLTKHHIIFCLIEFQLLNTLKFLDVGVLF